MLSSILIQHFDCISSCYQFYFRTLITFVLAMDRFIYVPAPHTAEVICEQLYESLVEWNLDGKISTVIVDNCTTNDAVISDLIKKIGKNKLLLEGKLLHMWCAAHILNLIVKDGLEVIQPAIAKFRESIAFWTATPKRIEKFEEIAKYVKVPIEHKLALDCKTRWNSTYKMLAIALPYMPVSIVQLMLRNFMILLRVEMNGPLLKMWFKGLNYLMILLLLVLQQTM